MACLRRETPEGRIGTFLCDEEGCKQRYIETQSRAGFDGDSPTTDCVLQLRLRAGDAQESIGYGVRTINWHTGPPTDKELNAYLFGELEQRGENDRFFLPKDATLFEDYDTDKVQQELDITKFGYDDGPNYSEIFKPMARGFVEGLRLHSVSLDPHPIDPACTVQWVKPAEDAGSSCKGPRPNTVYLDEYRRWVGSWEDATDEEVLDEITNSVEKGNLTNWMPVDTGNPHGPRPVRESVWDANYWGTDPWRDTLLDYDTYLVEQTTRDARNHGLSERQLKEFFELNNIKGIQVFTKAGEWRPVGVHDLGEGVQSTDELPGSSRVDSSDQGEVQDGPVVSEESEPMGLIVHGLYVPPAGLHGYKDFGSRVWGKESNHIRGEN